MRVNFEGSVYLITNRCEEERFFLLPKPKINKLIGAWLAKTLQEHGDGIELYAFIFLSNHLHLLLRDTKGQLAKFMWYFQLNLARAINRELDRLGHFFSGPYHVVPVLTDEDFDRAYAYVVANGVKAGLVAKAADGPFLSSLRAALAEQPMVFAWFNRTAKHHKTRRGQKVDDAQFEKTYELRLAIPPAWRGLTPRARRERIAQLVLGAERHYGRARRKEGRSVLGAQRILLQSPLARPKKPCRMARSCGFAPNEEAKQAHREAEKVTRAAYKEVFHRYREAILSGKQLRALEWPPHCYPPSSWALAG